MSSLNPDPRTWQADKLSWKRIADYKPFTMVDGPGVRCALYVSGCPFRCTGCFNTAAQSFHYGTPWNPELKTTIMADLAQPYVKGLSLVGGEPFLNTQVALDIVRSVKQMPIHKDIWCWTGYTLEEILEDDSPDKLELLSHIDVLVDGRFELELKDLSLRFRGSSNQRLINVPATLVTNGIVLWEQ